MRQNVQGRREIWGLVALFAVFIGFATYSDRVAQEATTVTTPSMYNARGQGVKALQLLLERQGYRVADLRAPWDSLTSEHGLVIMVEPFLKTRPVSASEIAALKVWVERGGSVLYLVTAPDRPLDPNDTVFGDIAIVRASDQSVSVTPEPPANALTEGIRQMVIRSPVRLQPAPGSKYTVLARDPQGAIVLTRRLGKGALIAASATSLASNDSIRQADNALFLIHIARAAARQQRRTILFDEYHHGLGLARTVEGQSQDRLAATPLPARLVFFYLMALSALLIYNGNRRFGRPKALALLSYRPSTDYFGSLGRLYQRAGAADVALLAIYHVFLRDLTYELELAPDTKPYKIGVRANQKHGISASKIQDLLDRCNQVAAGQRIREAEMLRLTRTMEAIRKDIHVVARR